MNTIIGALSNVFEYISENLFNLFKNKKNANDLLTDISIIKEMRIGICNLSKNNILTFFKNKMYAAIHFTIEMNGEQIGVIFQYGHFNYNEKDKSIVFTYK